jgi:hypothetical protein
MNYTWTCSCCGKQFNELPLDIGCDAPDPWLSLKATEREMRGYINRNFCVIDKEDFFVRGCLDVPIIGHDDVFSWGVWVSVSKKSFDKIVELWGNKHRGNEGPFFGWLCNDIKIYPETFNLKTNVQLRDNGLRPFIELEPTDHPLAIEQRNGIKLKRVEEIVAAFAPTH